ncbi:hypothetical protein SS50377_25586 [Spironucleus salmonicida]|uniref:Uncharacterized protein n=1 Tax=Spironucleus salmonicida TaxID=348837 RepID=V6LL89_9EUKA|nr:hypothetical protein SS50377_25586 [Spironucleus salmonicida]|eukprot:EST45133.1 Hypothetical protein SS50377_15155 [Spironucleus salmonicida]
MNFIDHYQQFYTNLLHSFRLVQQYHGFALSDLVDNWGLELREISVGLPLVAFNSFKLNIILKNIGDTLLNRLFGGYQQCFCGITAVQFIFQNQNINKLISCCTKCQGTPKIEDYPLIIFSSFYSLKGQVQDNVILDQAEYELQSVYCFDLSNIFKAALHIQNDVVVACYNNCVEFLDKRLFDLYKLDSTIGRCFKLFGYIKYAGYTLKDKYINSTINIEDQQVQDQQILQEIHKQKEITQPLIINEDFNLRRNEIQRWNINGNTLYEYFPIEMTDNKHHIHQFPLNKKLKELLIKNQIVF